jgi:hypothetical protein
VAPAPASPADTGLPAAEAEPVVVRPPRPHALPGARSQLARPDLEAEMQLIAQADAELRQGRYPGALHALTEHARRFPRGVLREERAALRVLTLCGQDPGPRAQRERERFLAGAPASVLAARVQTACTEREVPAP